MEDSHWKSLKFVWGLTQGISCIIQQANSFSSSLRLFASYIPYSASLAQLQWEISNTEFLKLSIRRGNNIMECVWGWGRRNPLPWSHCTLTEKCVQEEAFQTETSNDGKGKGQIYTEQEPKEWLNWSGTVRGSCWRAERVVMQYLLSEVLPLLVFRAVVFLPSLEPDSLWL